MGPKKEETARRERSVLGGAVLLGLDWNGSPLGFGTFLLRGKQQRDQDG